LCHHKPTWRRCGRLLDWGTHVLGFCNAAWIANAGWAHAQDDCACRVDRMKRRWLGTLLGGTLLGGTLLDGAIPAPAAGPPRAAARQSNMPAIGILGQEYPEDLAIALNIAMLRRGLRQAGFVEGQNIRIEYRWAHNQPDRLPDLAAELVVLPSTGWSTKAER
jgi:hypothetical protein